MEIRHNTKLLEEAIALSVRHAEIPIREAESVAAARMSRATARRRLATGAGIGVAAVGIGLGLWLALHPREKEPVVIREPYPTPGPTVTVTPEQKVVVVPGPTVTVTTTPSPAVNTPSVSVTPTPEPSMALDTHTPVVNYTKFASQTVWLFGRQWDVEAGHQYATENQKDWDSAWCYVVTDVGGITARIDLANRKGQDFAPLGPLASPDLLQRIDLSDEQARELTSRCPWLDGRRFSPQELVAPAQRIPPPTMPTPAAGYSPPVTPATPQITPEIIQPAGVFSLREGYDAVGNDLPGASLQTSLDGCEKECLQNQSCSAFTYNRKYSECFLKDKARIFVSSAQAISGYKVSSYNRDSGVAANTPSLSALNVHFKRAVTGRRYNGFNLPSFDICLIACDRDANNCMGVNYDLVTSECNLFSEVTGAVAAPTMQSGVRPTNR